MNNNTTKTMIFIFAVLLCFSAVGSCFALYTLNAEPISITITAAVPERELQGITANYTGGDIFVGQSYDPNELSVDANYTTGEPETLESSQYTVEITSGTNTAAGTVTYTVTYQDQTDTFTITVLAVELQSISATYNGNIEVGGTFDSSKLSITGIYNNGDVANNMSSNQFTISTIDTSTPGAKTLTITYNSNESITTTVNITVKYYYFLVGSFNSWTAGDNNYGLSINPSNTNERMITGVSISAGTLFKIIHKPDEGTDTWINTVDTGVTALHTFDGDGNIKLTTAGTYDFYCKLSNTGNSIYFAGIKTITIKYNDSWVGADGALLYVWAWNSTTDVGKWYSNKQAISYNNGNTISVAVECNMLIVARVDPSKTSYITIGDTSWGNNANSAIWNKSNNISIPTNNTITATLS